MTAVTDSGTTTVPPALDGWIAGTWVIDPAHCAVSFSVRHLMSRVRGTFNDVSGQIVTGPDPSQSRATAVIATASVSTGNDMRDGHLRSADFFDAERFPVMTFASRAVRPTASSWVLAGELTIRDVTRPVDLEVEFLGTDPAGLQGEPRIGFSARGVISRSAFGITFGLVEGARIVVGDQVDIVLDIQAFDAAMLPRE
ncbi:MAG: YceI family protein [Streptosporangiaceae bacterium]|nr:YceI family protein [Streptosporangiaceae bacterium]